MQEKRVGLSLGAKLNSLVFFGLTLLRGLSIPPRSYKNNKLIYNVVSR